MNALAVVERHQVIPEYLIQKGDNVRILKDGRTGKVRFIINGRCGVSVAGSIYDEEYFDMWDLRKIDIFQSVQVRYIKTNFKGKGKRYSHYLIKVIDENTGEVQALDDMKFKRVVNAEKVIPEMVRQFREKLIQDIHAGNYQVFIEGIPKQQ